MTLDQRFRIQDGSDAEKAERFLFGLTPVTQFVMLVGQGYTTVSKAVALFVADGWAAIKGAARGHSAWECRLLSAE